MDSKTRHTTREPLNPQNDLSRVRKRQPRPTRGGSSRTLATKPSREDRTDAILPMQDPYMMQIVTGEKTFEFRRYQLPPSTQRIWFYRTAPHSRLEYICEIDPGVTRGGEGDVPLPEDGMGNQEFNRRHKDWEGYDWAYRIRSVWKIEEPVSLRDMRSRFDFKSAPRGLVYLPKKVGESVIWDEQQKLR